MNRILLQFVGLGSLFIPLFDLCAQAMPSVPNPDFSRKSASGEIGWWTISTWPKSTLPDNLQSLKRDGKFFVEIPAVQNGAAGVASTAPIPLAALKDGFRLCFETAASSDYAGNHPWVFVTWQKDGKVVGRYDLKDIAIGTEGEWAAVDKDVFPQDIAVDATDMRINLASAANSPGINCTGSLRYTAIAIRPLGGKQ